MIRSKKQNIFSACIVLAVFALLLLVYLVHVQKREVGEKTITVEVEHLDKEKHSDKVLSFKTSADYLLDAVEEFITLEGSTSEYGFFVTSVDEEAADDSKQQWWGIYVDGEMGNYSLDKQPVSDGAVYTLRLNEGY